MKSAYECDMHCHSVLSDGNDTYVELVDKAAELQMKVVAITDHDVIPISPVETPDGLMSIRQYGAERGVVALQGIEFSCDTNVEDVHIVGYGCEWTNDVFQSVQRDMEQSKVKGYRELLDVLCEQGIHVTWEDVVANNPGLGNAENLQKKHIFETIAAKGYTPNWQEAKKMIQTNPIFSEVKREKIAPERAIEVIKSTGGIAILAHPYLIDEVTYYGGPRLAYIDHLVEAGLDGIEAAYTYSKTSYKGTLTEAEIEAQVRARFEGVLDIISGGSDYHADGKKGVKNPRTLGEKGITWEYFSHNPKLLSLIN